MAAFLGGGRFKEFLKKYGKVAMGVHFSVSAASITGLYVAINNNVDVESLLQKVGVSTSSSSKDQTPPPPSADISSDGFITDEPRPATLDDDDQRTVVVMEVEKKKRNRTAEMAATSGGALALAVLCNKALFPLRVPITIALTPPVARFLARRKIIKNSM